MANSDRLNFALDAAYEAGRSTLALFATGLTVDRKSDASPVTDADRGAERILRERIAAKYPQDGIYGEEEGKSGGQSRRWVIDPIDGTKSFISGVPLYSTLLSYEVEDKAILGIAFFPALDLMVYAENGLGAFANGRQIGVSDKSDLKDAVICSGSVKNLDARGSLPGYLELGKKVLAVRTWCDAYGHALVAMGRVEAMIDPVVEHYDISAVNLIVREAGGRFTAFDGSPDPTGEAVATNAALNKEILEHLRV